MGLEKLPVEILTSVFWMLSKKDRMNLLLTCRSLSSVSWRKTIHFDPLIDHMLFVRQCMIHSDTLRCITVEMTVDPHKWIPIDAWPQLVVFKRCHFVSKVNPRANTNIQYINCSWSPNVTLLA